MATTSSARSISDEDSFHSASPHEQSPSLSSTQTPVGTSPHRRSRSHSHSHTNSHQGHPPKRRRLTHHFSDAYLTLFNTTHSPSPTPDSHYPPSQLGAVLWTSLEKSAFFTALSRLGRHDVRSIASRIGTKSELEVLDYLALLRTSERERQLFEVQHKNVARAEIEAAVEIGPDCERLLGRAAEAVSGAQERYDMEVGAQRYGEQWVVGREVAPRLDGVADAVDSGEGDEDREGGDADDGDGDGRSEERKSEARHGLFHLSTFLDLSEQFFMNTSTRSAHDHWRDLVEDDERPAFTQDVLVDLHHLVTSLAQRLTQVSIFMALSRIRALSRPDYQPSKQLKREDVLAALEVLKMPADSWDFWTKLPRRNKMDVVSGSHSKGESRHQAVSLEDAEEFLSSRHARGRRRSMSASTERSSSVASEIQDEMGAGRGDGAGSTYESSENEVDIDPLEDSESTSSDGEDMDRGSDDSVSESAEENDTALRMDRNQRKEYLEEAQEEYMELLDQRARAEEETRLYRLLKDDSEPVIKLEQPELEARPKTLRKDEEELRGWVCEYGSEWEQFGEVVPDHEFIAMGRRRNRRGTGSV